MDRLRKRRCWTQHVRMCPLLCRPVRHWLIPWLSSLHPPATCTLYSLILRSSLIPTTLLRWNSCDEREAPDKRAHDQGSFFRSGTRMYSGHEDYGRGCKRWSTFFPLFSTSQDPPSLRQTPVWIADHLHPDFLRSRDDDDCVTMVVDVYSLASNPPEEPPCGPTNYAIQQNGQCLSHVALLYKEQHLHQSPDHQVYPRPHLRRVTVRRARPLRVCTF